MTKCIFDRWCLYAPLEMKGVSQKAHFMMESAVTTASLQAQLNARIAPGAVPEPGPAAPTPPLPAAVARPDAVPGPPPDRAALPLGPLVSVLSQSFCSAANGWLLVFRP